MGDLIAEIIVGFFSGIIEGLCEIHWSVGIIAALVILGLLIWLT